MRSEELRALWLVLRREYVERVKSFSFLASTFAAPVLFVLIAAIPALFNASRLITAKHIVIVSGGTRELARQIADTLSQGTFENFHPEVVAGATPGEHDKLTAMLREGRIDGFLWLDQAALLNGRIVYTSRTGLDSFIRESLHNTIYRALIRTRLATRGLSPLAIEASLKPLKLDWISLRTVAGSKGNDSAVAVILISVTIITVLEMSLLSYGIIVMRSVLEDKSSRMVEILLCFVTPRALMGGKLLGIGGLSLTQVAIWGLMAAVGVSATARVLSTDLAGTLAFGGGSLAMFALFYVLGYLLYSSLYAALGAAFNTADDAQYWSLILTLPLLFAGIAALSLFEQANSVVAVGLSLVPPLAPVMMSMRIAAGVASKWQIGLSLALMATSIYAAWALSAQIYRVGTLMYGKKPTLREIVRWLRYT
jgi:ABC-2 type transport system permease protein